MDHDALYHPISDADTLTVEYEEPPLLPKHKIFFLNICYFGFHAMLLVLCVEAVPAQLEAMVGQKRKAQFLGAVVATGAVMMFLTGPLIGLKSDRLVSKFGRRRPIMMVAMIVLCFGLMGMALSAPQIVIKRPVEGADDCYINLVEQRCRPYQNISDRQIYKPEGNMSENGLVSQNDKNVIIKVEGAYEGNLWIFIISYLIVTVSNVSFSTPYQALTADKTNSIQRGISSGVIGFMVLMGNIAGASIGLFFVQLGVSGVYACVIALVIICVLITIFSIDERPSQPVHEPINWRKVFGAFWEPLADADFRWVFITRFLMQQGISTVTGFLQFWLADMIDIPHCWSVQRALAIILVPMLITAALGSISSGFLSDKINRRKPLIILGGLLMCVSSSVFASIHGPWAFYTSIAIALIFGLGYGIYQAIDFALVMDVLPSERDKAKDLAVWHQAIILPQAIAAPIGGLVIDIFERVNCEIGLGYIMLFTIAGIYFLLSGLLVLRIRGAR